MSNCRIPLATRMEMNTIPEPMSGCHLWIGAATPRGYGGIRVEGRRSRAHRVAWSLRYGPIPEGALVLHGCDNPACVNTDHLHIGDSRTNMKEMGARGRDRNKQKTHCPLGHEYTLENTIFTVGLGWRECRLCKNASTRRRLARQRAARKGLPPPEPAGGEG